MPSAIVTFSNVFVRGHALIDESQDINELFNGDDANEDSFNENFRIADVARAGVVLAVSAMDGYFTNKFAELLVPFLKRNGPTDSLVELLQDAGLTIKACLEILAMERPYRRIRRHLDYYFDRFTTQKFDVINRLYACYGLNTLCQNAQQRSGRASLLRSVSRLIVRRHNIVHAGDLNKHGRLARIDRAELLRRVDHVRLFIDNCEFIINERMRRLNIAVD